MIAVALSGIFGRYLYIQIPRTIHGKEITFDEFQNRFNELSSKIQENYKLSEADMREIIEVGGLSKAEGGNLLGALLRLITANLHLTTRTYRLKKILRKKAEIGYSHIGPLLGLFKKITLLQKRLYFWQTIHRLFHYWHVFHKPFAIVMYLIMFVHIIIVVWLGYTWIL
jgi:hypothetical protein